METLVNRHIPIRSITRFIISTRLPLKKIPPQLIYIVSFSLYVHFTAYVVIVAGIHVKNKSFRSISEVQFAVNPLSVSRQIALMDLSNH